jgi:L-ribulose-5-phosphate 3-epimerase
MGNEVSLGIYEKAFPKEFDWDSRFGIARSIGFDFMELSIDESDERLARLDWDEATCREFTDIQMRHAMQVPTMCLSGLRKFPLGSTNPEIRNKGLQTLCKAIRLASRLGISIVQVAGYDVYGEQSTPATLDIFAQQLGAGLAEAEKHHIILAVENMETTATDSLQKVMRFINHHHHRNLQAYVDAGNLIAMGYGLGPQLDFARDHIAAFHIKDVLPNICRDVPFEKGMVDFDQVFAEIKRIGYNGALLLEMWANQHSDPVDEIRKAYSFINPKLRSAGLRRKNLA